MQNDKVEPLPFTNLENLCKYSKNERSNISEKLLQSDFYNPVELNGILPRNVAHRYTFLKKLKKTGISRRKLRDTNNNVIEQIKTIFRNMHHVVIKSNHRNYYH